MIKICKTVRNAGWTVVQDEEGALGPYAYRGDQWISFDDAAIIRKKSEMVRSMKIGGAMIWALDLDDFRNRCGCETYPLLKTINRVLRNYPSTDAKCVVKGICKFQTYNWDFDLYSFNFLRYDTASSTGLATLPIVKNFCQENSYRAHESDCGSYYHCVFGQWSVFSCPNGLAWNKVLP